MNRLYFLGGVLFGIVTMLVIFDLYPPPITIEASFFQTVGTIGTWFAAVVALSIAIGSDWVKSKIYKSNLEIKDAFVSDQPYESTTQGQVRLLFKNVKGHATAEEVEVYVNKVYDNGKPRDGFLPVPLSWTHSGKATRNFHPNQFGYLDFCRIHNISDSTLIPKLVLVAGGGVSLYEDIMTQITNFEIVVFQKSGVAKYFEIILKWEYTNRHILTVKSIEEIKHLK